ncbi:hypothetical protein C8N35_110166 [Breoghania corrubedonensis]|uniref:DUF6456 domain-containing protein n=1 Tax=Breoghania corrubedonensis TaxID=665038 RepID=A0A2T5V1Q7_9HYPH|nr:DUF6456 domain-containing protein [Breoghania corrubedonensis]PTW57687.1 hypothetical protein C8N35_110166 [Breoghania corrubedonensis]
MSARRQEAEARRRIVRALKSLAGGAAWLSREGDTVRLRREERGAGTARVVELAFHLYRKVRADGLVEEGGDGRVSLAAEGRAWLRRALAEGDSFAAQHRETVTTTMRDQTGGRMAVTIDLSESPLAWLASRRRPDGQPWVTPSQLEAGERLRADYSRAGFEARVTANWGDSVHHDRKRSGASGGIADLTAAALDARDRVHRALAAVGPELSGVLVDVCCELQGLEALERRHAWPARSGKLVLALALSGLARHYGLGEAATGGGRRCTRHWGAPDYRPRIDSAAGADG